jgi:hypothetical protein
MKQPQNAGNLADGIKRDTASKCRLVALDLLAVS